MANSQFTAVETEDIIYKRYKFGSWLMMVVVNVNVVDVVNVVDDCGWLCCVAININLCLTDFLTHPPWLSQANNWMCAPGYTGTVTFACSFGPNCTLINEPAGRWVETHGCRAAGRGKGCITTLWPVVKWDEIGSNGPSTSM